MQFNYPALITPIEDGRFLVVFPDFKWGVTDGSNMDEALTQAVDLLDTIILHTISEKKEIPTPQEKNTVGFHMIAPTPLVSAQAMIYWTMRVNNINNTELNLHLMQWGKGLYFILRAKIFKYN